VTGVDLSAAALAAASGESSDGVVYIQRDMRNLDGLPGGFDAMVCLWQSFGYFDAETNAEVLAQIARKLKPGGRFVLDIYHRGFFERNQGARSFERGGAAVTETKRMDGDRLTVRLDYQPSGEADEFEWQLFTPESIRALAKLCGLTMLSVCAGFDETLPASAEQPRMQLVFERL
jgi:SAM-dependent methyltransferase